MQLLLEQIARNDYDRVPLDVIQRHHTDTNNTHSSTSLPRVNGITRQPDNILKDFARFTPENLRPHHESSVCVFCTAPIKHTTTTCT